MHGRIIDSVSPSAWNVDAIAVVEAAFQIAVPRYFRPPPTERELEQFAAELKSMVGEEIPQEADIKALILATLGARDVAITHIGAVARVTIHGLVLAMITCKLSMTEPAIDDLILEGERTAFQRGWKPALADR
jgi:hypothetical protein